MSGEENKAVVRRVLDEAWNTGNLAVVDETFAADFVDHDAPPGLPGGLEGSRLLIGMYRTVFPDLHATVEDQLSEGDRVVTRWSATGTHQGSLLGIPGTGRPVSFGGITINRVVDGRIVEMWSGVDQMGMLQQIGAIPAPAQAG